MKITKKQLIQIISETVQKHLNEKENLKYYLYSIDLNKYILTLDEFDKNKIKKTIIKHLEKYPEDQLEYQREMNKKDKKKYVGNNILGFYEINHKTGKPSKIVEKGNKTYYVPLK